MKSFLIILTAFLLFACNNEKKEKQDKPMYKITGTFERFDPALDSILDKDAKAEIIAEGMDWSEGPLWIEKYKMLLFSDVPRDTIYKWTEENGKEIYLTPSGYTDSVPRGGEMGSNGLTLDKDDHLVLCQCGNRQIAIMDAPFDNPIPKYIPLAKQFNGKKFNSPNDVIADSKGDIFFTDPPYGLEKGMDDPKKEIPFQGVYKITRDGKVTLVTDSLTRPNGLAFLPGEKTLLVANSDPDKPNWYAFDVNDDGSFSNGRIFFSAAGYDKSLKGLPDGLKIDSKGNVYATGPGGVYIFSNEGKKLGILHFDNATSNCALSPDEKTLYVTNDMYVLRIKLRK